MDIQLDDILQMKKNHPCGENRFLVLRVGMDFRLRCLKCGRELMAPRGRIEKNIKKIWRGEEEAALKPAGKQEEADVR